MAESGEHLARAVALSGILSRRQAATAIRAGRVTLNGAREENPLTQVAGDAVILLDGIPLPEPQSEKVYYLLNKPRGYICSRRDRFSDRLTEKLLPQIPGVRLFWAGRLDALSEGMLICTNDGELVHSLESPDSGIVKSYLVRTSRPLAAEKLAQLQEGITDAGEFLKPLRLAEEAPKQYRFDLTEGKRHEIRRMIQHAGTTVRELRRIAIGKLALGSLPCGEYRKLEKDELALLLSGRRTAFSGEKNGQPARFAL